ncbi:MAG: 4-hydroxy-3-methylbut-2-enyl diphosphate reductase [Candidatus Omnitrophica bacterium]|nr:4-hydroxy-3-methylbut-2-enyl diphosphate reductase [Candidatus Omnitrophota bacterium]
MEVYLAKTQGFCAGVTYAIAIVESTLQRYGAPLYVYHEIVHNTRVVGEFRKRGVIFVEDVDTVPLGARLIFSAHGVSPVEIIRAEKRQLHIFDATCPLVAKVHEEAVRFSQQGCEVILIGHKGHQEIIGTSGYIDPRHLHIIENEDDLELLTIERNAKVAYLTQTTLAVDETKKIVDRLKQKFPNCLPRPLSDLCYATQNRQDAVKELATSCDIIIICGSANSSNSNRLRETGAKTGVESYIIDNAQELDLTLLKHKRAIGISSGASVPRDIVDEVVQKIKILFPAAQIYTFPDPEKNIVFKLPEI